MSRKTPLNQRIAQKLPASATLTDEEVKDLARSVQAVDPLIAQFAKERNEALLTLDRETILAHMKKWGSYQQLLRMGMDMENETLFWFTVHKGITANTGLPKEFRMKSKQWLELRGSESMDDGDLK